MCGPQRTALNVLAELRRRGSFPTIPGLATAQGHAMLGEGREEFDQLWNAALAALEGE